MPGRPRAPVSRWALAMMSWAAPYEADALALLHLPARPGLAGRRAGRLAEGVQPHHPARHHRATSRPSHFAHGRRLRQLTSDVRRTLHSLAFVEAGPITAKALHRGGLPRRPRFAAGVALEALQRVTRLAVSIGTHAGTMTVADGAAALRGRRLLLRPGRPQAARATFNLRPLPHWRKVLRLRDQARSRWRGYSRRFDALLRLGSPRLG